jgi:hypothetical protein
MRQRSERQFPTMLGRVQPFPRRGFTLTDDEILEILKVEHATFSAERDVSFIARTYGVTAKTIRLIVAGET